MWSLAYLNNKFLSTIENDLSKLKEYDIGYAVPSIRILVKKFKGKETFEQVPLLFNYGFFYLPFKVLTSRNLLEYIKDRVGGISNWVYLKPNAIIQKQKTYPEGIFPLVETVSEEEVMALMVLGEDYSVYSGEDTQKLKVGQVITLRGYPFDGIMAELLEIDSKKLKAKVNLLFSKTISRVVKVDFSNLFYTIYADHQESSGDFISLHNNISDNYEH